MHVHACWCVCNGKVRVRASANRVRAHAQAPPNPLARSRLYTCTRGNVRTCHVRTCHVCGWPSPRTYAYVLTKTMFDRNTCAQEGGAQAERGLGGGAGTGRAKREEGVRGMRDRDP